MGQDCLAMRHIRTISVARAQYGDYSPEALVGIILGILRALVPFITMKLRPDVV